MNVNEIVKKKESMLKMCLIGSLGSKTFKNISLNIDAIVGHFIRVGKFQNIEES